MKSKLYENINNGLFYGTIGALVTGLAKIPLPIRDWPLTLALFAVFFLLLRLKMYLDDYKYFSTVDTKSTNFKVGFVVGMISWVFWGLGALSVQDLQEAYFRVGIAITVSTIWIIVDALRKGAYREQYIWLGTNATFVLLLWALYRRNMPMGDWQTWLFLVIALLLVGCDFVFSKSIPEVIPG